MCRMCDDPTLTIADMRAEMFRTIERYGWMIQYVEGDSEYRPFAYTIGLTGVGLPELFVEGTGPGEAATLLNDVAHELQHGDLGPCQTYTAPDSSQYLLGERVDVSDLLGAIEAYGPIVRALELTSLED